jgi:hypothetical protein
MFRSRRSRLLAPTLLLTLAAAAPAAASSIVYQQASNIFLVSPDGANGYQVTADGGWESPSQADDGTIFALKDGRFWHLDRSGRVLGAPVAGIGGSTDRLPTGTDHFYGPFDPQVSPDGRTIVYWDMVDVQRYDPLCSCVESHIENLTTSTPSDHFEPSVFASGVDRPHWVRGSDRVTVANQFFSPNAQTWVPGAGDAGIQWWFGPAAGDLDDVALSPDGSKVVGMGDTPGGFVNDKLRYFATAGPAWTSDGPPYDNSDPGRPKPAPPAERCVDQRSGAVAHPSWSPDSTALAFEDPQGIWVASVPASLGDCTQVSDRLLVAGAASPGWGPADVVMAQAPAAAASAPAPPSAKTAPQPAATVGLSGLAVKVSRRRRATIRFLLSAPAGARMTLRRTVGGHRQGGRCRAGGGRGRRCSVGVLVRALTLPGRAGANSFLLRGTLARGSYVLTPTSPAAPVLAFTVR